ncbi:MAG TPA: hypothetical protein DGM69_00565 [Chloroflexi bacterium]|nr:hypothetical protein [Chloroflexota bacterium]|tara:strand:- start:1566 stop:2411 length:846 start_codon:yes stop_codon:yes gene_type:complete
MNNNNNKKVRARGESDINPGIFSDKKLVYGMIHLLPLPGTPFYEKGNEEKSLKKALRDAEALVAGGADGCVIQTIDQIYSVGPEVDPARLSSFATIVNEVSKQSPASFHVGVQILWNALEASLAVAKFCGGVFVRCNALVGSTMTPAGVAQSDPVGLAEYRNKIDAHDVSLLAEIESMHFSWLHGKSLVDAAAEAIRAGTNGVEIAHPDEDVCLSMISELKEKYPTLPVIIGGHTNHENASRILSKADGALVGSCFEPQGWGSFVDEKKVAEYVDIVNNIQ